MGRLPISKRSENEELKKGPWTQEEDEKLIDYMQKHGLGSWQFVPIKAGLNRCGKSCRLRWTNYLRPDIKRGNFSQDEEQTIIHLHSILGNKWSTIATHLPGRTDNEIKNYWNTNLRKKLIRLGIDPNTHQPLSSHLNNFFDLNLPLNSMIPNPNLVLENLAKIQILHNILQLLNTNPAPILLGGSSQNFLNQGLVSTMVPNSGNIDPFSSSFTPILETIPEFPHSNNNNNNDYLISPENLSGDQTLQSVINSVETPNYNLLFMNSSSSDTFWETELMEDEENNSFWKDIFI